MSRRETPASAHAAGSTAPPAAGRLLKDTLAAVEPPDREAGESLRQALAARLGDTSRLGALTDMLGRYAAATRSTPAALAKPPKCTIISCADHGVAAMNLSAYPPETTAQMTANYLLSKGAVANAMANFAGSRLLVADLGIRVPLPPLPGLLDCRIAPGTKNAAKGAAMTREEAVRALETGIGLAEECFAKGCRCFLPGEMGIANTTSSAAIAAALCGLTPEAATGRGTNISDERLKIKIEVVRRILEVNRPDPTDGLDVLQKVGGFELGCIAGIILGAARRHAIVILDGFNTGAAALIAQVLAPEATGYLLPSHLAAEPAHAAILKKLGLTPCMDMRFRLGEATGSSLVADFLDAAIDACRSVLAGGREANTERHAHARQRQYAAPAEHASDTMPLPQHRTGSESAPYDNAVRALPPLETAAMEACQKRIDSLAKPICSLGRLEELAVRLAGVTGLARPPKGAKRALLVFCTDEIAPLQRRLQDTFAAHAQAPVTIAPLDPALSIDEAYAFGYERAKKLAENTPLLGLALAEAPNDACGTKSRLLREALAHANGSPADEAADFLSRLPASLRAETAALCGAVCAAARCRSFIILDDPATELIAHCIERLHPELRPYILHVQPAWLALEIAGGAGIVACLGMRLVDAALHMLNDMKTFAEAAVTVANDGPGKGRQGGEEKGLST
ncbi:nicotinate-nucleotide--dimethylbenzimidazole phosphoribosyltransferase [Selenomonas sputigena]|uniref:Nicotinate-nucleotide--dimethylbenzimidazole phosphoribosyltransferase n=1 Tax=Selenomonas sputigena TaxID=69823 RepID=A0ABV3X9L0_9FIRM